MLRASSSVWTGTLEQFRRCGEGCRECVTYWTGPRDEPGRVDAVVHPLHTAGPGSYQIDDRWLHTFWVELGRSGRSVRVQVHTHAFDAFHSRTDDLWPIVHMPGFLSLVVPSFAMRFTRDQLFLVEIDQAGMWNKVDLDARIEGIP